MQQQLSRCRDGLSLLGRMFRLVAWVVIQASRLSRRANIFVCFGTPRLGSLHDNSGRKPKLLCG